MIAIGIFVGLSFILALFSFGLSLFNYTEGQALKKSTHQIQYIDPWKDLDVDKEINKLNKQIKENSSFDNVL